MRLLARALVVCALLSVVLAATADAQFPGQCIGDCQHNFVQVVDISDLVTGVNVALGQLPIRRCRKLDVNRNGYASVDELVVAVINSLTGCSILFPPTVCGDGLRYGSEECDDGNMIDGDGCSSACVVEGAGTLDQTFDPDSCDSGGSLGIPNAAPVGQEFVPQLPILGGVVVRLTSSGVGGPEVIAIVHRDTIDGEIVGSAQTNALLTSTTLVRIDSRRRSRLIRASDTSSSCSRPRRGTGSTTALVAPATRLDLPSRSGNRIRLKISSSVPTALRSNPIPWDRGRPARSS
jgi:cysteine-rich repeat protein